MSNFGWLIEAPGQRYLAARKINNMHDFVWTTDHNLALQFKDESQADLTMMAIRQLAPALFAFEATLGNAMPVEHGWMSGPEPKYGDEQVKYMVDRFLSWRLPETFNPDCGISFKRTFNEHTAHPMKHEPSGTNLFDAQQATEMVRYIIEGMPR